MQICKMTIDDYDEVYELWLNTPGMGLNDMDDSKEGIEKYMKRNPNTCFVATLALWLKKMKKLLVLL